MKEERRLLNRLTIASRQRPEIDLPYNIGNFEFSVVPRSMFSRDGTMHLSTDKSSVLHEIEKLLTPQDLQLFQTFNEISGVIMFDGMAVVNKMIKTDAMRTCNDFAIVFIGYLAYESRYFKQVRLIFDRYVTTSLKGKTREKRTKGTRSHIKVSDDTVIQNVSMKTFLSHTETKRELTIYLSQKFISHFEKLKKEYTVCKTNKILSSDLCNHDHEEADTLLIHYGIDVAKDDPFQELIVCSPDTDVFLLLISFYKSLCTRTLFRTGKASNNRDVDIGAA